MKNRLLALYRAVVVVLRRYPAAAASLVNIGVAALAYLGFHVTAEQLVYVAGITTALLGVLVHQNVTPVAKDGK